MRAALFALAIVVVALPGCGDDGADRAVDAGDRDAGASDAGPPDVPLDQFCEELSRPFCDANVRCCSLAAQTHSSVDACLAARVPQCEALFEGAATRDGRVRYDGAAARRLIDRVSGLGADCTPYDLTVLRGSGTHVGTQIEETDCSLEGEDASPLLACAPDLGCWVDPDAPTFVGVCRRRVPAGMSCGMAPCEIGAVCNGARFCETERADGDGCAQNLECRSGLCVATTCSAPTPDSVYCDPFR